VRKGRTAREIPPPLELECLRALWMLGEANVRAVRDHLAPRRTLAYTTVMTMLDRLARKQAVTRHKVGRSFVYTPLMSREDVRQLAVRELLDTLFEGSREDLISYLSGRARAAARPPGEEAEASAELDEALL
jgi:predicted transcriptional regulator